MGPISLFSLLIALCLAVMATLSVSTALATYASTQRQASSTESVYAADAAAQSFLAETDSQLAAVRSSDSINRRSALAALQENVDALAKAAGSDDIAATVTVASDEEASESEPTSASTADVKATFTCNDGRTLNVALALTSNATYKVLEWKTTTTWTDNSTGNMLWSGATQE